MWDNWWGKVWHSSECWTFFLCHIDLLGILIMKIDMENNERQPRGLFTLCGIEMWERFSYYGMRALLVLYLTQSVLDGGMGMDRAVAMKLYGYFTAFVYLTPIIGGWIADRWLGRTRSIFIGAIVMMLGLFCMAYKSDPASLYPGLFLLIVGNGFFKPNISSLLGELYPPGTTKKDTGFTYFYMGINLGAFFSPLVTGWLAIHYGYRYGFAAAAIGMIVAMVMLYIGKYTGAIKPYRDRVADGEVPLSQHYIDEMQSCDLERAALGDSMKKVERDRITVIVVMVFFSVFFFAGFEQAGSSLTLLARDQIDRSIGGWEMPVEWFQSLNPFFVVTMAPVLGLLWRWLSNRKKDPSVPAKMGMGMVQLGLGFFLLWVALSASDGKISLFWLVLSYYLQTTGELCLMPIGLSMVSKLSPARLVSLMMGVWLSSSFFANILGGYLAAYTETLGMSAIFALIAAFCSGLGLILLLFNKRLEAMMHGIR